MPRGDPNIHESRPWEVRREDDGRLRERVPGADNMCQQVRRNGEPCKNFAIKGATVCRKHGGSLPSVKAAALRRIEATSLKAADTMIEIAMNKKVHPMHRITAAKDILDRSKIGTTKDVSVEVKGFEDLIKSGALLVDLDDE